MWILGNRQDLSFQGHSDSTDRHLQVEERREWKGRFPWEDEREWWLDKELRGQRSDVAEGKGADSVREWEKHVSHLVTSSSCWGAYFRVGSWLSWHRTKQRWCQGQRTLDIRSVAWWRMAHWPRVEERWQSVLYDWSWEAQVKELGLDKSYGVCEHRINTQTLVPLPLSSASSSYRISGGLVHTILYKVLYLKNVPGLHILMTSSVLFYFLYNIINSDFGLFIFIKVLTLILMLIMNF